MSEKVKIFKVKKTMEISGSHHLTLPYPSPCAKLHGHNWMITVYCKTTRLNDSGMVIDFARIKKEIHGFLDHSDLNEKLPDINPTGEKIAEWIMNRVDEVIHETSPESPGYCYRVDVQESNGNVASCEVS